ncbi:hypothetical protein A9Q98_03780 [Thalassotalea sp. 42_200_T64]|nr:hypothetical protein A9Q98_03780 [Thalassotalea sp. 42_200_T64]
MTSWRSPDYQIHITLSKGRLTFRAGNVFEVELKRESRSRLLGGMIMITAQEITQECHHIYADLWIDSKTAIVPLNEIVRIRLMDECDPMYQSSKVKDELRKILPIELSGVIYSIEQHPEEVK